MMLNLAGYQQTNLLYAGSRTFVYRALRISDRQPVIIKILRHPHPNFNELVQFRNQYIIAHHLPHPKIVQPLALERYSNGYALVMPDEGEIALWDYWQQSKRSLTEFFTIAIQLAEALHCLNQQRIIHKDIKPTNILINPETQQIKLIDFSISTLLPKEQQQLTNPNVLEGTLAYISPEQTGRMNRGIDYRSDFYSLGVTFFELLTGKLPFLSNDAMELVHCHIAQTVQFPTDSDVPQIVQNLVLKLMAKNAEDRYQSALGLKHDLEQCLQQLSARGEITPFKLAQKDICDRFLIPEKLYGRETEVQTLLNAFARVATGKTEMMLVAGFSGIGKTAVINEVHKPIVKQRGYFIKGKFDQFNRNIPLDAFVQAFRDLIEQLLGSEDAELTTWKSKILAELGENGQVIIDVIPELEHIIGQQSSVPELSGNAAQNRFNLLFSKFVRIFTTKEHPLVIFLDDLQWADSASLNLLKLLMDSSEAGYLLVLGAYRDNEVWAAHPLLLTLDEIKKQGANINTLTLAPLNKVDITCLVADTLLCSTELAKPLSQLVYQKTQGNPFFTTQFLQGLYSDDYITFEANVGYWQCDLVQVRQFALTDDVVAFMMKRLQKLSEKTQEVLKFAACIGNKFDLETLAIVREKSPEETAVDLWQALSEGLIIPQSETYKFYLGDPHSNLNDQNSNPLYKFLHDRVQQAAYSLIPQKEQESTHLKIGRLLANHTLPKKIEANIFNIVSQFNTGLKLVTQQKEKNKIAQYNLIASQKAKNSAAYQPAWNYANMGIEILGDRGWQTCYQLTLELFNEAVELAYLNGDFIHMEELAERVIQNALTIEEKINIYQVKIQACFSRNKLSEGIEIGLNILKNLGVDLPENPSEENLQEGWSSIDLFLGETAIQDLVNLPPMSDPNTLAVIQILSGLYSITYAANINLWLLTIIKQVILSLQNGNTAASAFAYANYGRIKCSILQDLEIGQKFGELALAVLSQLNVKNLEAKTLLITYFGIKHWTENLNNLLPHLKQIYIKGLETGDLEVAAYGAAFYCSYSYFVGKELPELSKDIEIYRLKLQEIKQQSSLNHLNILAQAVENLQQKCQEPWELNGEIYNEKLSLPIHLKENDILALASFYLLKPILVYMFGDYAQAALLLTESEKYSAALVGYPSEVFYTFYSCLLQLASYSEATSKLQKKIISQVSFNQEKLTSWAVYGTMNCQHKSDLVAAEKARALGEKLSAIELYDRAISGAKANAYLQEEALANELAAKFYLDWGKEKIAAAYMQEAYYCYSRWGALAKTAQLEAKYPQLLTPILQRRELVTHPSNPQTSTPSIGTVTTTTSIFDIASAIKASQAISGEIELEALLNKLMQIVLENAGADKGTLILNNSGSWEIAAQCDNSNCDLFTTPLIQTNTLPSTIINTVKRTQETVLINQLEKETTFAQDSYFSQQQPKSIFCTPILNQGKLIGLLYLENNLTAGAFTPDRIEILNLLTSQAAISIENARLYCRLEDYSHNLEVKVEQRTQELQEKNQHLQQTLQKLERTQVQLIQAEKMSGLGQLVAGIAHEINNPINFIAGNLVHAREYFHDLLELLALYQQDSPQPSGAILDKLEEIELGFLSDDLEKLLSSMQTGSDRIRKIILGLKNFSRLQESERKEVDIHEGLESTLLILQHRLKASGDRPEITVRKHYGNLPLVNCYASQLNQVFLNILTNAIDFLTASNSSNHPEICITTEMQDRQTVKIRLADNGLGMSERDRQRVFDPFFTTKPIGQGTGLGLSISYQIVTEQHGGQLECISQPGKGTEFVLSLPIYPSSVTLRKTLYFVNPKD